MSVLDTAMNPNSVLVIDNLNEAKELHDKIRGGKIKIVFRKSHRQRAVLHHLCT